MILLEFRSAFIDVGGSLVFWWVGWWLLEVEVNKSVVGICFELTCGFIMCPNLEQGKRLYANKIYFDNGEKKKQSM